MWFDGTVPRSSTAMSLSLMRTPGLEGKLVMQWVIGDGKVRSASALRARPRERGADALYCQQGAHMGVPFA